MARRDHFKQAQRRNYRSHTYKNPHLLEGKRGHWKFILGGILVVLFVLLGISLLLAHPFFRINQVQINGVESLEVGELESVIGQYLQESRFVIFHRSNRFLFSSDDLSDRLSDAFALASIRVSLGEGSVFIELEERTSNLLWKTQGRLYVADLEGTVVREISDDTMLSEPNLSELPIFIDKNNVHVETGSVVLTAVEVDNAFSFLQALEDAGITYRYTDVDRLAGKWVKVATVAGFGILFDLSGNIENQFENLVVVLRDQVDDETQLEYIDLRFGDKVYYK